MPDKSIETYEMPLSAPLFPRLYVPPVDDDTVIADECDEESAAAVAYSELAAIPQAADLFEPPSNDKHTRNALFEQRYLVVLTCTISDTPVGLFEHPDEAVEFARDVYTNPEPHSERYLEAIGLGLDGHSVRQPAEWLSVSVVEFSGPVPMCRTELFNF